MEAVEATADAPYWRALAEGRLMLQRCADCGRWRWPAVYRCGDCGAWDPPWEEVALEGRVFSWTKTHHRFGGTEALGVPFITVLAELPQAGGRRLMGLFEGEEAELAVGRAVSARIDRIPFGDETLPALRWRPA